MGLCVDSGEFIDTDKDTHFTGAIAQNAVEEENIGMPANWATLQIQKAIISNITIESDQNLDWEVQFFLMIRRVILMPMLIRRLLRFASASDGKQVGDVGLWRYDANPAHKEGPEYEDRDRTSEWHIALANRSVTAKAAGATGEVVVRFRATPII